MAEMLRDRLVFECKPPQGLFAPLSSLQTPDRVSVKDSETFCAYLDAWVDKTRGYRRGVIADLLQFKP